MHDFDAVFAPEARFRDPFNDVKGIAAIQRVFRHMYEQCDNPRFEVVEFVERPRLAYLHWLFRFSRGEVNYEVAGVSRVEFDDEGRVVSHIDYWDPTQLYDRLPLIGRAMRWLRGRLSVE